MTTWADVCAHAVVGVGRRPIGEIVAAGRPVSVDAERSQPEAAAVLDAAAILEIQRRAGAVAARGATPPDPSPAGGLLSTTAASQLLDVLLGGATGRGEVTDVLLRHWLAACAGVDQAVPDHLLVRVLEAATAREPLREVARSALGPRGDWLAGLNPDWSWVAATSAVVDTTAPVDPDEWAQLPKAERVAALERERRRDPAAGRALVESTWATDKAADRQAHIEALAVGLGPDDEDLIESALDDRSVKVRAAANERLTFLPSSRRSARMAERLRPLIQTVGVIRKKLVVELPDDPDDAGVRDGLVDIAFQGSRRMWWLLQMTRSAPLSTWVEASGRTPAELAGMALDPPELIGWWAGAANIQRDAVWAPALMAVQPLPSLVPLLPVADAAAIVESHIVEPGFAGISAIALAEALPGAWSPSLSAAVLAALRGTDDQARNWVLEANVSRLTARLAADAVTVVEQWRAAPIPGETDKALRTIQQALTTIDAIDRAFAPGEPT